MSSLTKNLIPRSYLALVSHPARSVKLAEMEGVCRVQVTDKSLNGTLINKEAIKKNEPFTVQPNDVISLAQVTIGSKCTFEQKLVVSPDVTPAES